MLPNNYQCEGQMSLFDYAPELLSGRTFPEPIPQTVEKTLDVSLRSWQESKTPKFQYLCLKSGNQTELLNFLKDVSHGEPQTLSISESPNVVVESHLSWILETNPDPKYNLSPKACQGILNRARKREKKLPELLEKVLIQQSASRNGGGKPGGRKGILIQKDHVGALSTLNIQAVLNSSGGDVSGTLDASYYKGCGERQGAEREVVCVGNGQLAQAELSEKVGALNCMHDQQAIILLESNQNHATIQTDGISTALPASMGMGGGYVPMVCKENVCYGLDRASFNQGQNAKYDISIQEDIAQPIVARGPGGG